MNRAANRQETGSSASLFMNAGPSVGTALLIIFCSSLIVSRALAQSCMGPDCEAAMASVESGTVPVCIGCSVSDANNVINTDLNDFGVLSVVINATGSAFVSATFGAAQAGGNYAGYVIEDPQDLADGVLVGTLTLTTFASDVQQETATDTDLTVHGLAGDQKAIEFLTSLSFDEVRIDVGSLTGSVNDINAYYAYSSQAPLPVELVAFDAILNGHTIALRWQTASETNNAGFEVQYRLAEEAHAAAPPPNEILWQPLTFVEGHGTTDLPQAYQYRVADLMPGRHVFRLKQIDFDGTFAYSPEVVVSILLPERYRLSTAFPNPFRLRTTIDLTMAAEQEVCVEVFNAMGRRVRVLYEGPMPAHRTARLVFEPHDLPSGLYFIAVTGKAFTAVRPMTLLR